MTPAPGSCPKFWTRTFTTAVDPGLAAKMHKAIAVIQFKVEGAMIAPSEYEMDQGHAWPMWTLKRDSGH